MEEDFGKKKKLSIQELKIIFDKFDTNKDQVLDKDELKLLVTQVFKETKKIDNLNEIDTNLIHKTVENLLKIKDTNSDGSLDWSEFSSYFQDKDIIE
jgi:Ca2+-binding EF-hand superfamily protein